MNIDVQVKKFSKKTNFLLKKYDGCMGVYGDKRKTYGRKKTFSDGRSD